MNLRVVLAILAVAMLLAVLFYSQHRTQPLRVSGFLEADEIRVGSRVGGRVAQVHCQEGQAVKQGTTLFVLEPFDLEARRQEAEGEVAARQAELERLQSGFRAEEIGQAQARVDRLAARLKILKDGPREEEVDAAEARRDLAVAQLDRARRSYERVVALFRTGQGSVTREEVDRGTEELQVAEQLERVRIQELQLLLKGPRAEEIIAAQAELTEAEQALQLTQNGYRAEDIKKARAAVAAAEAKRSGLDAHTRELEVRAPIDSIVEALELQPGDLVAVNAPVLSLLDPKSLWVRAYVPENRLRFQTGQDVRVTTDSYPGESFPGQVTFISRDAEFTPRNVQTPEERSRQVFRIKVTLLNGQAKLRAGMAADVWLE